MSGKPKITVAIRLPGSIEVRRGTPGEVAVASQIRDPENVDYAVGQNGDAVTVNCHAKSWNPLVWGGYIFSSGPRTDVTISAPPDSDLTLETMTDPILVDGVNGTFTVETKTGSIHLQDCKGIFRVKTHTGTLDLDGVDGSVDARNTVGHVRYSGVLSKGENSIKATTGDIDIALKGENDLRIDASTTVGHITCNVDLADSRYDKGQYVGQHATGRIGAGAGKLILETTTGSISIHK